MSDSENAKALFFEALALMDASNFRDAETRLREALRLAPTQAAVLTNLARDSNGHLRIALNSSAVGPGEYQLALEGLDWRGNPVPQAWASFSVSH